MRFVRWMLPELKLLMVPILLFKIVFYALALITWPIHAPIRWLWRRHKAAVRRERDREDVTREAAIQQRVRAAKQAVERENDEHRAAGEYVPHMSDAAIAGVCHGIAIVYGAAYAMKRSGISARVLQQGVDRAEAKFGWMISEVFGVNPRLVLQANGNDFRMCLAASAFLMAYEDLKIASDSGDSPVIKGALGVQALGVFARATNTAPGFAFATLPGNRPVYFDQYYVARNFIPDQGCSEESYYGWCELQGRLKSPDARDWHSGTTHKVTGAFGPELTWLARIFKYGPV